MQSETKNMRKGLGVINAILTMAGVTLILVWMVTSLTNGDPLWFLHSFEEKAETLVIYWDGETFTFKPNDPGYAEIMNAFADSISNPAGFEWSVAFSGENIKNYRDAFKMLEVQFAKPVQVHTRHPYPEAKTYLVPLDKTHAQWRRVFAFTGITPYTSGPLNIQQDQFLALYQAVETAIAKQ